MSDDEPTQTDETGDTEERTTGMERAEEESEGLVSLLVLGGIAVLVAIVGGGDGDD